MKTGTIIFAALAQASLQAGAALADQCAWVQPEVADKLLELEAAGLKGATLISYCAPCADGKVAYVPLTAGDKFEVTDESDGYKSISYKGESLDLAYVYLGKEAQAPFVRAQSLAALTGCEVGPDTPTVIDVSADGAVSQPD